LRDLQAAPQVERLLLWDEDPGAAQEAAAILPKAEVWEAPWGEVLEREEIPVVCTLLPNRENGAAVLEAIRAGKHVYSDKPGARTAAEMAQILAACEQTGCHFCPCYPWRVDPMALEIRELIREGALGDPWSCSAAWMTSTAKARGPQHWLFHQEISGGGILSWLGCHWIDLLSFLLDSPVQEVSAIVATRCTEDIDVEDSASLSLRFANGVLGNLRAGYALNPFDGYRPSDLGLTLEGSLGSVIWRADMRSGYELRSAASAVRGCAFREIRARYDDGVRGEGYALAHLTAFLEAARGRGDPPATARDALHVLRVIEAAYRSSRERQHVDVRAD